MKVLLLLVVLLLSIKNSHQQATPQCQYGTDQLLAGETAYSYEVENGLQLCRIATCTVVPFPKVTVDQTMCSEVMANCSVPSTPHMQNLSVCCQHCSECDFLSCPVNSRCVEVFQGAACQCLTGYNEVTSNGQFACVEHVSSSPTPMLPSTTTSSTRSQVDVALSSGHMPAATGSIDRVIEATNEGRPPSSSSPQSLPVTIILAAGLIFCFLLILLFFILGLTFGLYFSKIKQRQISHMVNGDLKTAGVAYEGGDAEQWTTEMQELRKKKSVDDENVMDVVIERTTLETGEDLSFSDAQTQSNSSVDNLVEEHQL